MNKRTLKKLLNNYNSLNNPKSTTAIKYASVFKNTFPLKYDRQHVQLSFAQYKY